MTQLTKTDRQQIAYYLSKHFDFKKIGDLICRDKSVISREVKRNSVLGKYSASKANHKSYVRRYWVLTEPQKIRSNFDLISWIEAGLKQKNPWSPEQIAGRWNKEKSDEFGFTISAPTIYNYLYEFRPSLCKYLCTHRFRKKKNRPKTKKPMIRDRIWIDDRPKIVDQKDRIGDWEGDTICSLKGDKTSFLVIHDRASRFICVSKSCDKKTKRIVPKIKKMLKNKPQKTLSVDNGVEFKGHQKFGLPTYFCHPYSSWEKGAVEYSNRLIRRHFPKKTRLADVSPKKLSIIVDAINNTPRKCLDYKTPVEIFQNYQFSISSDLPPVAFAPLM